jgi:hypothetical protein
MTATWRVGRLQSNGKGGELANFNGDTVPEVVDQAQHGIQRVGTGRLRRPGSPCAGVHDVGVASWRLRRFIIRRWIRA